MPFPWAQAISTGIQLASQERARSLSSNAQRAQIGAEFDAFAGQVTQAFNALQNSPVISEADFNSLLQLYTQLKLAADTLGPQVPYIKEQWEGPHYRVVYEARLQQIQARVTPGTSGAAYQTGAVAAAANSVASAQASIVPGVSNGVLLLVGGGLAAYLLLKN